MRNKPVYKKFLSGQLSFPMHDIDKMIVKYYFENFIKF